MAGLLHAYDGVAYKAPGEWLKREFGLGNHDL
jgi:hypothetical protein